MEHGSNFRPLPHFVMVRDSQSVHVIALPVGIATVEQSFSKKNVYSKLTNQRTWGLDGQARSVFICIATAHHQLITLLLSNRLPFLVPVWQVLNSSSWAFLDFRFCDV